MSSSKIIKESRVDLKKLPFQLPGSQITLYHTSISRAVLTDLDRPLLARRQPQVLWLEQIHKTSGIVDLLYFQLLLNLPLEWTCIIRFQNLQSYAGLMAFFTLSNTCKLHEPFYARRTLLKKTSKTKIRKPTMTFVSVELLFKFNKWRQNFEKNECSVLGEQLLLLMQLWEITSLVPQFSEVHLNH